jgi:hypothetical protein
MRDSFIFYRSFFEAAEDLGPEEKCAMFDAICDYALNFVEPSLEGTPKMAFRLIKPQLDANIARFNNGQKGGRPSSKRTKSKPKRNLTKTKPKPNHNLDETKPKPLTQLGYTTEKPNVNVNGNLNHNLNGNENENAIDHPSIDDIKEWMYHCGCRNISESEKFWLYYESKGWMVGQVPMVNWKAAVLSWIRRIKDKDDDGFQFDFEADEPTKLIE